MSITMVVVKCKRVFLQPQRVWHTLIKIPRYSFPISQRHVSDRLHHEYAYRTSHCNMNVPAVWHWLQEDRCIWRGHPRTRHTASLPVYYYDVVMRHCAFGGGCGTAASRLLQAWMIVPSHTHTHTHRDTHEHVSEHLLPSPGLSLAFSERCWPPSPQSAPSPNSAQPSWSADRSLDAGITATTIGRTATATFEANASISSGEMMSMNATVWCYGVSLGRCASGRLSCVSQILSSCVRVRDRGGCCQRCS